MKSFIWIMAGSLSSTNNTVLLFVGLIGIGFMAFVKCEISGTSMILLSALYSNGSVSVKVDPFSRILVTEMFPPNRLAYFFAIARPKPCLLYTSDAADE